MATDEITQEEQQTIRTAADIRIDELEKRISEMEASHKKQVDELMEANRGLYAMLQSRQETAKQSEPVADAPEPVPESGEDPAIAAMNKTLGIKEV